ncbi:MAG: hypothetical protein GWN29_05505 [Gammaproteobacteria bacterium]|nr:hypothetical protein [Gammaproteobacteria bacterium]
MISEPQRKRLFAILFKDSKDKAENDKRADTLKESLAARGIDSTKAIPKSDYEDLCEVAANIAKGGLPF